jgi:hypothetical protein
MAERGEREPSVEGDLTLHPGRPRNRDEIDPELLVLPRPRARIGWLLAVSVIVFCGYFMFRLRGDLVFSRAGDDPTRLRSIAEAAAADPEDHVSVEAVPDRAFLLRVFASEAKDGHRLAPVLGSGDRLWIMFDGSHWDAPAAYDEVYQGRVKRLGDLPFYGDLVEHLATMQRLPRGVKLAALRAALEGSAMWLQDIGGDRIPLASDTAVAVGERVAGQAAVTVFRTDAQRDESAWRHALEATGLLAPGAPLVDTRQDAWTFQVAAPEGVDAVEARLVAARLFAARAEPYDRTLRSTWGKLSASAAGLTVGGTLVPWSSITVAAIETPRSAPADARVIITTEAPGDYWYLIPVYLVFAIIALLFGWALVRALRQEPSARTATPAGEGARAT